MHCLSCHLLDGEGTELGPDLHRAEETVDADDLERWITDTSTYQPTTRMPAFSARLAASAIRAIAEYLATRKHSPHASIDGSILDVLGCGIDTAQRLGGV